MTWKLVCWSKHVCNAVILPSHWSYIVQKQVTEIPLSLLQDTVTSAWCNSCCPRVQQKCPLSFSIYKTTYCTCQGHFIVDKGLRIETLKWNKTLISNNFRRFNQQGLMGNKWCHSDVVFVHSICSSCEKYANYETCLKVNYVVLGKTFEWECKWTCIS